MKSILITIAFMAVFSVARAQQTDTTKQAPIFTAVEQEPTPVGGMGVFYQYLANNIHYPDDAKKRNIQGKVFLTFVVEKDGTLSNIQVLRGVSDDINAEAVRVFKNAPKWNPGIQRGRPVRVQYNVPISFTLQNN
jgi:protein TonB